MYFSEQAISGFYFPPTPKIKIVQNPLSTNTVTIFNSYERSCNFRRKDDHDNDIYYRNF